jgi:hypothetical protein
MVNPQRKGAPEMTLTQRNEEGQTFPPLRSREAFAYGVCIWSPHGCSQDPDTYVRHRLVQILRVDLIPVMDHKAVGVVARQRLTLVAGIASPPRGLRD